MSNEVYKGLAELLHRRCKFVKYIDFVYRDKANVWTMTKGP